MGFIMKFLYRLFVDFLPPMGSLSSPRPLPHFMSHGLYWPLFPSPLSLKTSFPLFTAPCLVPDPTDMCIDKVKIQDPHIRENMFFSETG